MDSSSKHRHFNPWSKKHKAVTKANQGGVKYSLSNSYAQPLTQQELIHLTTQRGDHQLVHEYNNHTLGYTANGGSLDLRQQISQLYGPLIQASNILVFTGAQVALQTAAFALASDCHSIVFSPGYQSTVMGPSLAGGNVTTVMLSAANGWQVPIEDLVQAIQPGVTKYLVLNEPYNPAGTLMSPATQLRIKAIAQQYNIVVLSDEVYRLLEHDPNDRLPAMADLYYHGISCVTLSKPWGGCGVTIGWLAFQDLSIKQRLVDVQYFNTACPSRASELQALMTLKASDVILDKNLRIIRANLQLLAQFMHRYEDLFEWVPPKAGAVAFIKFKGPLSSEELGEQLAAANISMKPAYCFSDKVTDEIDYFRVGFGERKMPHALAKLVEFVEARKERWRRAGGGKEEEKEVKSRL